MKHEEGYEGKLKHLQYITDWEYETCEQFVDLVIEYLDKFGYMEQTETDDNFDPYNENDFGKMLMDLAVHYNEQQGVTYKVDIVNDKYDDKIQELLEWLNR